MSKQVLSVRDFAIIYDILLHEIQSAERPWDFMIGNSRGKSEEDLEKEHKERLASDYHYQDLLRIRDALGTLNIEIETPDVSTSDKESPCGHNHTKIYDKSILMSNPPKRNWTCALCGVKGSDWVESALDSIMFQNGSSMETIPGNTPIRGKAKT